MKKLIADLNVELVKLRNYHYNVVGGNFASVHVALEAEYNQFNDWIDALAERMKMSEQFPPVTMKEFLELSSIKEVESKEYSIKEVFEDLISDYSSLIESIKKQEVDNVTEALLDDVQGELEKRVWFFKSSLK